MHSRRYHIISSVLIFVLAFPVGFLFCSECFRDPERILPVGIYSSVMWVLLWKGNEAVANLSDHRVDWVKTPVKRLILGLLGHLVYTVLAMLLLNYAVYLFFGWNENILTLQGVLEYCIPALIITYFISLASSAYAFFMSWRESAVEKERMEKELISSKYESLKNQVNPHFLFNSLNVLTSLVYKDADLSAKFIKKLSKVYRYVLEAKDKQIVSLEEELVFLQSYIFLLQMRHKEGLDIGIEIPSESGFVVAPLALQMLVENAVKHNMISIEEPLRIRIHLDGDFLVVENNIQRKQTKREASSRVGLSNIKARYKYLSKKEVSIADDGTSFEVKLPLIQAA